GLTVFQASRFTDDGVSIPRVSVYSAIAGFLIVGVAGYSAIPVASALQSGSSQQELEGDNLREATLSVDGMVCQGCKMTVKNYLESMEGTKQVRASLSEEKAWVVYDVDKTSAEKLADSKVFQGAYSATLMEDKKYKTG
ncbi:MAG: heavy-metal-associated domain-containing protein, partial [Candidatus Nanohaloarchaea archaeon]|nr:heavy-metal-associated domain-containing protein [Candidatus Nanohaloarchaea archaeon]